MRWLELSNFSARSGCPGRFEHCRLQDAHLRIRALMHSNDHFALCASCASTAGTDFALVRIEHAMHRMTAEADLLSATCNAVNSGTNAAWEPYTASLSLRKATRRLRTSSTIRKRASNPIQARLLPYTLVCIV